MVRGAQTAPQYGVSLNSPRQRQEIWNCPFPFDSRRRQRSVTEEEKKSNRRREEPMAMYKALCAPFQHH